MKKLFITITIVTLIIGCSKKETSNSTPNTLAPTTSTLQYTDLLNFNGLNSPQGDAPQGSLTLSGNVLYGMTALGGAKNWGCIFSVNTDGSNYKDLYDFNYTNGGEPYGSLTLSGNVLYGMTYEASTVFSINTDGSRYKVLINFNGTNGSAPYGSLLLSGNILYGMTSFGGSNNWGCIFSIKTNGSN